MEDWPVIFYICHSIQPLAECDLKWAECRPITELAGYRAASARHRVTSNVNSNQMVEIYTVPIVFKA